MKEYHGLASQNVDSFASSWALLAEHPRLKWMPPYWRGYHRMPAMGSPVICAVERNLIVSVRQTSAGVRVALDTGPLADFVRGDSVYPLTPVMEIDPRLHVEAESFENAVRKLA